MANNTLILFHAHCVDGFGAAYAAWKYFGDEADYFPIQYEKRSGFDVFPQYEKLYILDFSFPAEQLRSMTQNHPGLEITLIDHHKTAIEDLVDFEHQNVNIILDITRSGAALAWKHFFPKAHVPDLLLAIEDRDLWKFKYPDSKKITAALYPYKRDFEVWDKLDVRKLVDEGSCVLRYQDSLVKYISKQAFRYPAFSIVQTPVLASDVCNYLLETTPNIAFSVAISDRNALETQVSLRSVDYDVEVLAKSFGGGGHKCAAGFVIPRITIDALAKQIQDRLTTKE